MRKYSLIALTALLLFACENETGKTREKLTDAEKEDEQTEVRKDIKFKAESEQIVED